VAFDLFSGSGSSYPQHFVEYNGNMYFNAGATPGEGTELYRWDPVAARAVKVTSINPGGASPESFCVFDGALYFSAYEPTHGRELWRYRSGSAVRLTDIIAGPEASNPYGMTVYRGAIYFGAEDGVNGTELWRYDGATAELVANINQNAFVPDIDPVHHSWPGNFFVFDDVLYFSADDGVHGRELWMYDGVEVRMVADIYPGQYGSDVGNFVDFQDTLIFTANDGVTGQEMTAIKVYQLIQNVPTPFRRGDANADGRTDLSDALSTLLYLFGGGAPPPCAKSADADDSGDLSIADPIGILSYLFAGGPSPSAPFGSCGLDGTDDGLTCDSYPPCGE
jgi:ELWxxDGT repeat protein